MPISVNLTAGPNITVMSDGGRVIKVLSQRTVQFKIVSAGPQGISAFGVWQAEKPGGSLDDYFEAITGADSTVPGPMGDKGDAGVAGPKGDTGPKGADGRQGIDGRQGVDGADGKSAFQLAVDGGFSGTEAEWLVSLQGAIGNPGDAGHPGADGKSAYQIAIDDEFVGTEAEWLISLQAKFTPASTTYWTMNFIYFRLAHKINRFDRSTFEKTSAVGNWADRESLGYS